MRSLIAALAFYSAYSVHCPDEREQPLRDVDVVVSSDAQTEPLCTELLTSPMRVAEVSISNDGPNARATFWATSSTTGTPPRQCRVIMKNVTARELVTSIKSNGALFNFRGDLVSDSLDDADAGVASFIVHDE